jgi:tRNA pseudouridine55 synthase
MTLYNVPSGWIAVDKPCGMSSAHIVSIVKCYFKKYKSIGKKIKVGHAGTLDPFASGVLPLAIGEATKTIAFAQNYNKEYIFDMQFGKQTDTLDPEGKIVLESDITPSKTDIENILPKFLGETWQTPPHFSALKINGQRAYNLARKSENFELQPRLINVSSIQLVDFSETTKIAAVKVECAKGTYIRSLARDIALNLGSCAYVSALRRTKVGLFCEKKLILLENIKQMMHNDSLERELRSVDIVLDDIPVLFLSEDIVPLIKNGQTIFVNKNINGSVLVKVNNLPIALGIITNSYFKPTRVFNL